MYEREHVGNGGRKCVASEFFRCIKFQVSNKEFKLLFAYFCLNAQGKYA